MVYEYERSQMVKIGIGRDERYSVSDWVLSNITSDEKTQLEVDIFPKITEYIIKWLQDSTNIS